MSSDGGLTGLADQCWYKCGRDAAWRFRCSTCVGPTGVAVQFLVCSECRPRTKCFHCLEEAIDKNFSADSDQLTQIDPSDSSSAFGMHSVQNSLAEQLRRIATTIDNLAPRPELRMQIAPTHAMQIASKHAKNELNGQLRHILGRAVKTSDVVYNTALDVSGHFQSQVSVPDADGHPAVCRGFHQTSKKGAERSAALQMCLLLQQRRQSPFKN